MLHVNCLEIKAKFGLGSKCEEGLASLAVCHIFLQKYSLKLYIANIQIEVKFQYSNHVSYMYTTINTYLGTTELWTTFMHTSLFVQHTIIDNNRQLYSL